MAEQGSRASEARPAIDRPGAGGRAVPRAVWGGTALLVLGRLWSSCCTLLAFWLLARQLGEAEFGRYTFWLAVFVILDTLADFGTGSVAVQMTAGGAHPVPDVLAATRRVRVATGLAGVAVVGGGAVLAGEPGAPWILLASLYPVTHALELSTLVFRNRIDLRIPVLLRLFAATLSLALVLLLMFVADDRDPAHYLVAVAAGSTVGNLCLHAVSRRHLPRERARSVPLREVLTVALPLGLASLCMQAYFYLDNLFVRPLCGEVELGRYNIGVRVMSIGIMVALYATQAALPWLAREHARGELGSAVARLGQPLFALAGLVCGAASPWIGGVLELFGPGFSGAAGATRWLLGATAAVYAGATLMTALVAAGRTRSILAIAALGLAVNLVSNALFVPRFGIEGAGASTLATEAVVALSAGVALVRAGAPPGRGARAWAWLGGPVAFALGALVSASV